MKSIPVVVQYRHVHLSAKDEEVLFGKKGLASSRRLEHQEQFVSNQTVSVLGKNGQLDHVRVFGPAREHSQVELSATDAFALGIDAPVRISGDIAGSGSCELVGPKGKVKLRRGVIIPAPHLHCTPEEAKALGLEHHATVTLAGKGRSTVTIEHVTVRVHPTFSLTFHLTNDEAAHYWIQSGDHVILK